MLEDHHPIVISEFKGLFGIDAFDDSVPMGYFIDDLNTITYGAEHKTRDGFKFELSTGQIKRFFKYRRQGEAVRTLALIDETIWDLTTGVAILTVPDMLDFTVAFYNNRAFISPTNGITGLPGEFVYIYNGIDPARKAGGAAPTAGFIAVVNGDGYISSGVHIFAWLFETDSGFVTGPSPAAILTFDGTKAVDFTNIPLGPVGTVARRLIASRAIQDYNGNELAYEMFFVPNGRISNNINTVLLGVNFFDGDLQLSADYTYDQMDTIPAVVFIRPYGKRLCFGAPNIDKNLMYVSNPGEPESVNSASGFVIYDPFETEGIKDGTEFRDNFYTCKLFKTYTVRDNTYEPSTWHPVTLDSSIGCDVNGIAKFYDASGSKVEFFTVSSPAGLFKYSGLYEEFPISRNIRKVIWDRLHLPQINRMLTYFDQERLRIYIQFPIIDSNPNGFKWIILVGNYENGFAWERIKWHPWSFLGWETSCIGLTRDLNGKSQLEISAVAGNMFMQEDNRRDDANIRIVNYTKYALVNIQPNAIHHYGAVGFRMMGAGLMDVFLYGQDGVDAHELPSINLGCNPGKEFIALAHFQSEKAAVAISFRTISEYFHMRQITMYTNVIFATRPLV